jgi:hypothetical protein
MEQYSSSFKREYCQLWIFYPIKLYFNPEWEIKTFQDKDKLKQFMSTNATLQRILDEIINMEQMEKQSQTQEG